jgi:hypothetical protein
MATKTETTPTILHVLRTARADLKAFVDRGISRAEKRTKSMFRFARSLTRRLGGSKK